MSGSSEAALPVLLLSETPLTGRLTQPRACDATRQYLPSPGAREPSRSASRGLYDGVLRPVRAVLSKRKGPRPARRYG
jgi:hypothetical protein